MFMKCRHCAKHRTLRHLPRCQECPRSAVNRMETAAYASTFSSNVQHHSNSPPFKFMLASTAVLALNLGANLRRVSRKCKKENVHVILLAKASFCSCRLWLDNVNSLQVSIITFCDALNQRALNRSSFDHLILRSVI